MSEPVTAHCYGWYVPPGAGASREDDFAEGLKDRAATVATTAHALLRKAPGLYEGRDHDDVVSLLKEVMWAIWREGGGAFPEDWERQLLYKGRVAVQRWADASAGTGGLSGASEQRRRLRAAMAAEPDWQASHPGRLATRSELSEWWQSMGGGQLAEPKKLTGTVPLGPASEALPEHVPGPEDQATDWAVVGQAVEAVVAVVGEHNERLRRFASTWLMALATGEDVNIAETAQALGLSRASATRYVAVVRKASMQVLPGLLEGSD